ncbi:MAG TPA: hypothetical protein EYO33_05620 [Phycisphaerales bacterium]|nr:hypothetical protein [Phycisphaerales bacterium]
MKYRTTPDGKYFVVDEVLWRCTNPHLAEEDRRAWVSQLMKARRAVKKALKEDDSEALKQARARVQEYKVKLGERGPVWWTDGEPDYNRKKIKNTPYRDWWESLM